MDKTPSRRTHRQFTIGQWMVVMAVIVVLFTVLPAGFALVVVSALVIPLLTDLAIRPTRRDSQKNTHGLDR